MYYLNKNNNTIILFIINFCFIFSYNLIKANNILLIQILIIIFLIIQLLDLHQKFHIA